MFLTIFLHALILTFMLVGLVGLILPIFPGIAIIWLSAFFYMLFSALMGGRALTQIARSVAPAARLAMRLSRIAA